MTTETEIGVIWLQERESLEPTNKSQKREARTDPSLGPAEGVLPC